MSVTASEHVVSGLGDLVAASPGPSFWITVLSGVLASLPGVLIAVRGWRVTHRQTLDAQARAFRNSLEDAARNDILGALHLCAQNLSELYEAHNRLVGFQPITLEHVEEFRSAVSGLIYDMRAFDWTYRLQEYEPLYPESVPVRVALAERQAPIHAKSQRFGNDLRAKISSQGSATFDLGEEVARSTAIATHVGLMRDLGIYVQNRALARMLGQAPPAPPIRSTGDWLRLNADGLLEIVPGRPPTVQVSG